MWDIYCSLTVSSEDRQAILNDQLIVVLPRKAVGPQAGSCIVTYTMLNFEANDPGSKDALPTSDPRVVTRCRHAVLRANSSIASALHSRQLFSAEVEDVDARLQVLPEALAGWSRGRISIIDNANARKLMLSVVRSAKRLLLREWKAKYSLD
jgi:hypothetical protein